MNEWEKAQQWEKEWHGSCANSLNEELKQLVYARKMGLEIYRDPYTEYNLRLPGRVIDIGGGPYSLLLKAKDPKRCAVIDPCDYPQWVIDRYESKGIDFWPLKGEEFTLTGFDEAWIYNCLQHVDNPEQVISNARKAAKLVRIFEWIDTPVNEGHLHTLTKEKLDTWLGGYGKTEMMNGHGCYGLAYYSIVYGNA